MIVSNRFKRVRTVHDKERCPKDIRHLPKPRGTYDKSILLTSTIPAHVFSSSSSGNKQKDWIGLLESPVEGQPKRLPFNSGISDFFIHKNK